MRSVLTSATQMFLSRLAYRRSINPVYSATFTLDGMATNTLCRGIGSKIPVSTRPRITTLQCIHKTVGFVSGCAKRFELCDKFFRMR